MFDVEQMDKRLASIPPDIADAVRFAYVESHFALEDTARVMADRQQAQAMDAALASVELESSLMTLQQQVEASKAAGGEFAPPGVTDGALMTTPESLPAVIRELSLDAQGHLQYKAERQRHTMGSLVGREVDDTFTVLSGLADSRLQAGASAWQLARWDHENSKWIPWNLGAAGEYLKSNGAGVAPSWGAIPLATTSANGLLRQLPASGGYSQFMNGVGNWRSLSMGDWYTGSANHYDMLRLLPIYGAVDPETGEPTILGWDWQPFAPDMDDLAVWYGGDAATAADDPLLMLIARPVSNGDDPETFTYQGESMTIAEALMGAGFKDESTLYPKYLRMVQTGGVDTLEWEDLCDDVADTATLAYWKEDGKLGVIADGTAGQVLTTSGADGTAPAFAPLPAATTTKAGVIGPLPTETPTTKYLNGAGAFVVPGFSLDGHDHDGVYAPVHSHPYVPIDYDYPFAELLSWMTEAATAADDPWQLLVMKPISNGDVPETFGFQTSTETIAAALMGAGFKDESTLYPKYLRMVQTGGVDTLEWEDLCDDLADTATLAYWKEDGKLGVIADGTAGQVLTTSGADGTAPAFAPLPDAAADKKGVIQLDVASATTKYLNGAGQWTTPPDTNTDTGWPSGGTLGYVWTSNGSSNNGSWQEPTGGGGSALPPDPVLDKSIALWANSAGTITPDKIHYGSSRFGLFWDGNNGLKSVQAATADKQVLTWNNGGEPTWATPTVPITPAPTTITTIGAAVEGSETALTNQYIVDGTNGLDLWMVSRVVYNHSGDKKIYQMMRRMRFGVSGQLRSVSAETRVEVDAAVSLFA